MTDMIDVDLPGELRENLIGDLENELRHADEFHSTEQVMREAVQRLRDDGRMRRGLAEELADILEFEADHADEPGQVEERFRRAATSIRDEL